ncbi:MAG TPA: hypothetical protein ENH82_17005 [bacterium]|nr:hypothetical protein [bacterium]
MPNYKMKIDFTAREDWNRDTLSKFGKSLLTTTTEGKVRYRPHKGVNFTGGVGQIYDRRFENEDNGTNIHGKMSFDGNPSRNFYASFDMNGATTSNLDRSHDLFRVRSEIAYDSKLANVRIGLGNNRNVRGYFSDVDRKRIEKRGRMERNVSLVISRGNFQNYRNSTAFAFSMGLGAKSVDDTANNNKKSSKYRNNSRGNIKDFNIKVARGIYKRVFAQLDAGYQYNKNDVERNDRTRAHTDISMQGKLGIGIGNSDSLSVIGMIKRTRIDTPEGIANDRDELKIESGVNYTRQFSNNFKTGLDFRVLETHYVNINSSQSSQNKWLNTYQLSPSIVYTPMRSVRFSHVVNLYAYIMDYDFDSDTRPRSNITRRVSSESLIDAELSSRTRVILGFMLEENDYGNLDSNSRKLPVEEGLRRFGNITVDYKFTEWLIISPQYVYSIIRDNDIIRNEIIRRQVDQTYGFKCKLFKDKNDNYSMVVNVKRIVRKTKKYPVRIRDYVTMTMRYEF